MWTENYVIVVAMQLQLSDILLRLVQLSMHWPTPETILFLLLISIFIQ